jgi:hypothetical protein
MATHKLLLIKNCWNLLRETYAKQETLIYASS